MEERQRCHHEQSRSCCQCNPVIEFADHGLPENAVKFVRPIKGQLKEAWGLGSVWVTNRGSYYGLYHDYETENADACSWETLSIKPSAE